MSLHPGDIIVTQGEPCEVLRVNECAATVEPMARVARSFRDSRTGRVVQFQSRRQHFYISPNSAVQVIGKAAR